MPALSTRREYFRLPYPVSTGATLMLEGTNYQVGEISEGGLRIISDCRKFSPETPVQGTLTLSMGARCIVKGTVLRVDEKCVVVKLEKGPTGYDMIREQRHVSKVFPDWKPIPA